MKQHDQEKFYLITANDLLSGDAIFYAGDHGWSGNIAKAVLFTDNAPADEAALKLNQEQASQIVGAYVIAADKTKKPLKNREALRTTGPTNYWHGKQEYKKEGANV